MALECWAYESSLMAQGYQTIAGVDEAGRGPLAGPVVAAAVVLPNHPDAPGLTDSKKLTPRQRDRLYGWILDHSLSMSWAIASHVVIDQINILQASLSAMREAILKLCPPPDHVLVDGNQMPRLAFPCQAIVKGDSLSLSIAAASVIAKVCRDRMMQDYHKLYPEYGFDRHKGYPTKAHYAALEACGPSPIHRRSFRLTPRSSS